MENQGRLLYHAPHANRFHVPKEPALTEPGAPAQPESLLPRVARGDSDATRLCVDRFGGLVWSIARRLKIPDVHIEDAVQEVFIELWKHAARFDPAIASETTFVAVVARRRLIDRLRKLSRQVDSAALSEAIEADATAEGWRGQGLERQITSEDAIKASAALDQLSVDQQRVLRLSIYRGLSHDLIARVLNLPLGTVKTHARRGLIRLRELLSDQPPRNDASRGVGSGGVGGSGAPRGALRDLSMGGAA